MSPLKIFIISLFLILFNSFLLLLIIIFAPCLIASLIYLFPSVFDPLIAKKAEFFLIFFVELVMLDIFFNFR